MIWYRRDDLDLLPQPEPEFRSDELREHVDNLPLEEKHLVERVFFGGIPMAEAAREAGMSQPRAKELMRRAFATLRSAVLEDHTVGELQPTVGPVEGFDVVLGPHEVGTPPTAA
jgi:DNA-directed RNA polymerase specialized sigma24 family protein